VWAEPSFGPILVTCSADKTIKFIAEEKNYSGAEDKWVIKSVVTGLKECTDIKFAPKRFGLLLAACQRDDPGTLAILSAASGVELDPVTIKAQSKVTQWGSNCLDWDSDGGEMIAVG